MNRFAIYSIFTLLLSAGALTALTGCSSGGASGGATATSGQNDQNNSFQNPDGSWTVECPNVPGSTGLVPVIVQNAADIPNACASGPTTPTPTSSAVNVYYDDSCQSWEVNYTWDGSFTCSTVPTYAPGGNAYFYTHSLKVNGQCHSIPFISVQDACNEYQNQGFSFQTTPPGGISVYHDDTCDAWEASYTWDATFDCNTIPTYTAGGTAYFYAHSVKVNNQCYTTDFIAVQQICNEYKNQALPFQ